MLFPTIDFAIFFGIVFVGNWLLAPFPTRWRVFILVASYVFYGWWDWRFVFLLAISTVCTIAGGRLVHRARSATAKRAWLIAPSPPSSACSAGSSTPDGSASTSTMCCTTSGWAIPIPLLQVTLPVGISFFTFMGLSYVIDIYRGSLEPSPWLDVAVFVAFFPHLVAGPIVRGSDLLPQIRRAHRRDPRRIALPRAAYLIFAGLFKKVVLSSYVSSQIVDPVFANPHTHSSLEVLLAIYGYAVQIYCDFSGYTDIAIGCALLLGFRFPGELRRPLHGAVAAGLLAALAHHLVLVAARLPVHPARRQPGVAASDVPQHHDHDGARRPVARCRLDLRRLGRLPRHRAVPRATTAGRNGSRPGSRAQREGRLVARLATFCDLPARLCRLGLLPRHLVLERWHSRCSDACSPAGGSRPRW